MGRARRRRRREPGGIEALADLIDAHRGAFEYDWRSRFNKPLHIVGTKRMTWGEALRLTEFLLSDPSSKVGSSAAGWSHSASREAMALWNFYDLVHQIAWSLRGKGPRPKPHPRPWPDSGKRRATASAEVTQADIVAALRRAGHDRPVPLTN